MADDEPPLFDVDPPAATEGDGAAEDVVEEVDDDATLDTTDGCRDTACLFFGVVRSYGEARREDLAEAIESVECAEGEVDRL